MSSSIPRIIWQTSQFEWENMPNWLKFYAQSWIDKNPDWEYRYQSNYEFSKILEEKYGQLAANKFLNLPGQLRGDFWRFYILKEYGGVYADIDSICYRSITSLADNVPLGNVATPCADINGTNLYLNWFIMAEPESPEVSLASKILFDVFIEDKSSACDVFDAWNYCVNSIADTPAKLGSQDVYFDGVPIFSHIGGAGAWSDFGGVRYTTEQSFIEFTSGMSINLSTRNNSDIINKLDLSS